MTSTKAWSRGDWMQTYTGRQFFPLDPQPDDIDQADIAHALSLICRYGGHVSRFYSVAEHCVLMSHAVPAEDALWALLHDATEAYVGDMVRPLKRNLPAYMAIEDRVMSAIGIKFRLRGWATPGIPQSVKAADNAILLDERDALMPNTRYSWEQDGKYDPLGVEIHAWSPAEAEVAYLARLAHLTGADA